MSAEVKYHISPATGRPNRCYAEKKPCPLGGQDDHYPDKATAREAYEKKAKEENGGQTTTSFKKNNVVSISANPKFQEGNLNRFTEALGKARLTDLNKGEISQLDRLAEGKKIPAKKLDRLLQKTKRMGVETPYNKGEIAKAGQEVHEFVSKMRAQDPTPNTIPTVREFDPSTQTTFSNLKARDHAGTAAKSMSRNVAHAEWMEKLSTDADKAANDSSYTAKEREEWGNERDRLADEAFQTRALVQAQFKEIEYLYDNNPKFKGSTQMRAQAMMSSQKERSKMRSSEYDEVRIDFKNLR